MSLRNIHLFLFLKETFNRLFKDMSDKNLLEWKQDETEYQKLHLFAFGNIFTLKFITELTTIYNWLQLIIIINCFILCIIHLNVFQKSKYCYYIELVIVILLCFEVILKLLFKKYVNWKIKIHMYKSYDLGQGFISGQKHIEENCNYLVNYKPTSKIMKEIISSDKYEIIKEMVNIHQKYPEVVIAIKTQITCRKVLNDAIDELMSIKDVMLEEQDYELLQKI
ncbi:uncharacterized protein LOC111632678 isoform X2 [Centruroides sculpturatus]|uniref:uncharacterized protein LOC111632678 isoform X2 n=1 Tax=Centruroides sculpturatus TaxID=218467 RepID=UPI000C6D1867|nr:uncharacterized protein LOC111632678 isoform X2 [Centruroides sculpturatus]